MANSRLKDFYDLYLIAQTFSLETGQLAEAIQRTFERRGTALPTTPPIGLTEAFARAWAPQWRTFLTRERMAAVPGHLEQVITELRAFLMPLAERAHSDQRANTSENR